MTSEQWARIHSRTELFKAMLVDVLDEMEARNQVSRARVIGALYNKLIDELNTLRPMEDEVGGEIEALVRECMKPFKGEK